MKKQTNENTNHNKHHAPGSGSDKHHPETPTDANERFKKDNTEKHQDKPS